MNLSYKILWIDDEKSFIDSFDNESLEEYVASQGFDLEMQYRMTPEEIKLEVDGSEYDLLIIDYNIAEGDLHGSDVIRQVRDKNCLTEVIFYSSSGIPTLRNVAAEKELEGVYFSGRKTDQLLRKITDVFNLTVRKVVDVNNMRGIVMAGVADLDHAVVDVIRGIHELLDGDGQTALRKKLLGKLRPTVKHIADLLSNPEHPTLAEVEKMIQSLVDLDPADFETLVNSRAFDSHKRIEMAEGLCKEHEAIRNHKDAINSIKVLLQWRNALAHQKSSNFDAHGFPLFELKPGQPESFNDEKTRELRRALRTHRVVLQTALSDIKNFQKGKGT